MQSAISSSYSYDDITNSVVDYLVVVVAVVGNSTDLFSLNPSIDASDLT